MREHPSGPNRTNSSAELTGLSSYATYHYRIVATNHNGVSYGPDRMFTTTPGVPSGRNPGVTAVHSDRAVLHGEIDPNGANTSARFEYVNAADFEESGWAHAKTAPAAEIAVGMGKQYQSLTTFIDELEQGTIYHYRIEGTNSTGSGGAESTFRLLRLLRRLMMRARTPMFASRRVRPFFWIAVLTSSYLLPTLVAMTLSRIW